MRQRRSRLAVLCIAALSVCVAVGLASGAAEAKKKGKKKSVKQIAVSKTTPTAIPPAPNTDQNAFVRIPLTVGKKAKGKVVNGDAVSVTLSVTDPDFSGPGTGDTGHLDLELTAPNGRTLFLEYVDDHNLASLGPLTLSPNSAIGPCEPDTSPPPPPCRDPDQTLGPPYAGTIGESELAVFTGVGAKGTWTFTVQNSDDTAGLTLDGVSITIGLQNKPA